MPQNDKDKAAHYGELWGSWGVAVDPPKAKESVGCPEEALQERGKTDDPDDPGALAAPYTLQWGQDASGARVLTGLDVESGNEEDHRLALEALRALQPLQSSAPLTQTPRAQDMPVEPTRAPVAGITVEEAVQVFLASADVKPASLKNYRSYLHRIATPFFGASQPVAGIDQKRFAQFVAHVLTHNKAAGTSEGYVSAFTTMGKWHRARGEVIPLWNSSTLLPRQRTPESADRAPFSMDELGRVFSNATKYKAAEPEKFWVTVCIAFLGSRVEELAQVNLRTDLHFDAEKGIHYFRFNENADKDGAVRKSIKKNASFRVAPIHSSLVKAGFIQFLEQGAQNPHGRPFERLFPFRIMPLGIEGRPDAVLAKFAHELSKWGGKELRSLYDSGDVLKEKGKSYFHSMRHTFSTYLSARGVPEEQRTLLSGHSFGGENAQRYSKTRNDHVYLSALVEEHMGGYVDLLKTALARLA